VNANILMDLGIHITVAYLVSKLFQKVGIPQVVGFILVGVFLGRSGFHLITAGMSQSLQPLVDLALGFIGFTIGRELEISLLRRGGRQLFVILLFETLAVSARV